MTTREAPPPVFYSSVSSFLISLMQTGYISQYLQGSTSIPDALPSKGDTDLSPLRISFASSYEVASAKFKSSPISSRLASASLLVATPFFLPMGR